MSNSVFGEAIRNLERTSLEKDINEFSTINLRPTDKVAGMLEILSIIQKKSPTAIIAEELSIHIANHAASSVRYANAILKIAEQNHNKNIPNTTAIGILKEIGLIIYES